MVEKVNEPYLDFFLKNALEIIYLVENCPYCEDCQKAAKLLLKSFDIEEAEGTRHRQV